MAPRAIAQAIVNHMEKDPGISKVEVAGPGFVNFYLSAAASNAGLPHGARAGP